MNFREFFNLDSSYIHLNNAGVSAMPRVGVEAVEAAVKLQSREVFAKIDVMIDSYEECRVSLGKLLSCDSESLALTANCASAISQVAFGLDLKPGDEVLQCDQEYPSNAYPWIEACRRSGATHRRMSAHSDLSFSADDFIRVLKDETKVVAVSWVQFQTGAQVDLELLGKACHDNGTLLVVDGIQGAGVLPFDFSNNYVDAFCGGSHKWLCGPLGLGFLCLSRELQSKLNPIAHGAITYGEPGDPVLSNALPRKDIRRFEPGAPGYLPAVATRASVDLILEVGRENIQKKIIALNEELSGGLRTLGAEILGGELCSPGIVTFRHPKSEIMIQKLQAADVTFATRAGGIRLSPHAYNESFEIERLLQLLKTV